MSVSTRMINGRQHVSLQEIERIHDFYPLTMRGLEAALAEFRRADGQQDTVFLDENQVWLTDIAYYAMCSRYPKSFPDITVQAVLAALGHYSDV